mmetsp:Transcript_59629/g.69678  ORF Transcript_59629/g.69678 Transcript_59629/m.69678 type:complete len:715 (+) Transcript_59629:207-2351(+)|eukprot:CAMPEP_0194433344 /NCGR_PEP_ID=MMETSP0176-20130528/76174_1 /TAXON_ID=216777 /ORGANISM="Proboscia alata, Strain PI-D3" /LENGTH=714 /DNA_ID=CAMNT_0039250479 /DNA_START=143 /DNA_END=2287 /DNA_ORIENTATION=+
MASTRFIPKIPDEIKNTRIGSCYNSKTGELMYQTRAFYPGKLFKTNYLQRTPGSMVTQVLMNKSSKEIAQGSFMGMSAAAEASFWGCTASVSASAAQERKSSSKSFEESVVVLKIVKGESMFIRTLNGMTKKLFNCATEEFRTMYSKVILAKDVATHAYCYKEFTDAFGDECVTRIELVAGSACRITLKKNENSTKSKEKYSASLSASSPVGSVSGAAEWGSEMSKQNSSSSLNIQEEHEPKNNFASKFIREIALKYTVAGLRTLSEDGVTDDFECVAPESPPFPEFEGETIGDEDIPEKVLSSDDIAEKKDTDDEQEKKNNGKEDMSLESYREERREKWKKLIKDAKPGTVVKNSDNVTKSGVKFVDAGAGMEKKAFNPDVHSRGSDKNEWTIDKFTPIGFVSTPWVECFPDLLFDGEISESTIHVSIAWIYYLTRLEFLQYLNFLADYVEMRETASLDYRDISEDIRVYERTVKSLEEELEKRLKGNFTELVYKSLVVWFDGKMKHLKTSRAFSSLRVYEGFFQNYDRFHNNPAGFISFKDGGGGFYYRQTPGGTPEWALAKNSVVKLLEDAIRYFPLISQDGVLHYGYFEGVENPAITEYERQIKNLEKELSWMVGLVEKKGHTKKEQETLEGGIEEMRFGIWKNESLIAEEKMKSGGGSFRSQKDVTGLFGINYEDHLYEDIKVRGPPMLQPTGIESILKSLEKIQGRIN